MNTRGQLRLLLAAVAIGLLAGGFAAYTLAQPPSRGQGKKAEPKPKPKMELPSDTKLVDLYVKFVNDAEKIAADYERQGKFAEAQAVYNEILKFVPEHKKSQSKLKEIKEKEETADRKSVDIAASPQWQDTGVWVIPGKTLTITAHGNWSAEVRLNFQGNADGLELPDEVRDHNLGALIASVVAPGAKTNTPADKTKKTPPPERNIQLIGQTQKITFSEPGKLMLKINAPTGAELRGRIKVDIVGTFERR